MIRVHVLFTLFIDTEWVRQECGCGGSGGGGGGDGAWWRATV
jgi:hypothetical protein